MHLALAGSLLRASAAGGRSHPGHGPKDGATILGGGDDLRVAKDAGHVFRALGSELGRPHLPGVAGQYLVFGKAQLALVPGGLFGGSLGLLLRGFLVAGRSRRSPVVGLQIRQDRRKGPGRFGGPALRLALGADPQSLLPLDGPQRRRVDVALSDPGALRPSHLGEHLAAEVGISPFQVAVVFGLNDRHDSVIVIAVVIIAVVVAAVAVVIAVVIVVVV